MKKLFICVFALSTALLAQNKIDLSRQTKGALPAGSVPASSASNFGGVKDLDCTGSGHVVKLASGTLTCAADGGGSLSALAPGATGSGTYDFSLATLLKARFSAGLTTSTNGDFGYDSTNGNWHFWNGADAINAVISGAVTDQHCPKITVSAGKIQIVDNGAACLASAGSQGALQEAGATAGSLQAGSVVTESGTAAGQALIYTAPNALGNAYISSPPDAAITSCAPYVFVTGDRSHLKVFNSAGACPVTLPQAGSAGFTGNWQVIVQNVGAGAVTITPTTSTIGASAAATLVVNQGEWCIIRSDNTNYPGASCSNGQLSVAGPLTLTRAAAGPTVNCPTCALTTSPSIASVPVDSGAVNAYVIAPAPAFSSLANGDIAYFTTANANSGASTVNVNGLGVKSITKKGATAVVSGDILASAIYKIIYDGVQWELFNPSSSAAAGVTSVATTAPITGGTITTTGTIACATCTTNAAGLTSGQLVKGAGGQAAQVGDLSGDTTTAGSTVTTTSKVNGVSYGASPGTNTVPVVTGANTVTYEGVPNAALANAATTPNGQTCTLGSTCNVNSGAAAHSVSLNEGAGAAMTGVGPGTTNQLLAAVSSADPVLKSLGDLNSTQYVAGGGTAQAQTATLAPAVTALTNGLIVNWLPVAANTAAAPTLAVNGLTAKSITKYGTTALVANDLTTTAIAEAIYDGTEFQLQNPQAALPVAQGGSGTGSTLTGVMRGGNPMTASELSQDVTTSGSNVASVVGMHPHVTTVVDGASPYTVIASDDVLACNGVTGDITLNLPAAIGSNKRYKITNQTATATKHCIAHPSGTDTIDGLNSNLDIKRDHLSAEIQDVASGKWQVLEQQALMNNFGVAIIGQSADITIGNNANTPAPTLTALAGSLPVAGTYQVATTYVNSLGQTGGTPTCQTITTSGSNNIQVTSPSAQQGMTQYNVFSTVAGGTCVAANLDKQTASAVNLGTNTTINAAINTGLGTYPTANTADTAIFSSPLFVPVISAEGLDMVFNGVLELTSTNAGNQVCQLKISLWSANNTSPTCVVDLPVWGTTSWGSSPAFNYAPFTCAGFGGTNVASGTQKTANAYLACQTSTVTGKYQNATGTGFTGFATYSNHVINMTW